MKFVVVREFTRSGKIFVVYEECVCVCVCVCVWIKFYRGS